MENKYVKYNMNDEYARDICSWKYEGKYSIYNLPSYSKSVEKEYGITKKENRDNYICYTCNGKVVAYVNMKKMANKKIFMGIGLRPDYCGQGQGNYFLKDSIQEIKNKFPNYSIYLEVRSFNQRAIKAYKKVGFVITGTEIKKDRFGNESEFIIMELEK